MTALTLRGGETASRRDRTENQRRVENAKIVGLPRSADAGPSLPTFEDQLKKVILGRRGIWTGGSASPWAE